MPDNHNPLLQKVADNERMVGLMNTFLGLSKEEQVALMEWARGICMKLAAMQEKQQVLTNSGGKESIDLPAPKMFIEIALKVGLIRAIMTGNTELEAGCDNMYKHIFGDAKFKLLEEFKEIVLSALRLSKW